MKKERDLLKSNEVQKILKVQAYHTYAGYSQPATECSTVTVHYLTKK